MDKVLTRLIQAFLIVMTLYLILKSAISPPACTIMPNGDCIATSKS